MAYSKFNAKEKELLEIIRTHYPGHFLKSNKPYNKGAHLINRKTGKIVASAETNFKLLDILTDPRYDLLEIEEQSQGFFSEEEVSDGDYVYKSEMEKLEETINDAFSTAEEWAGEGKEVKLLWDYSAERFRIYVDGEPVPKSRRK